jgi:hypothetical protein
MYAHSVTGAGREYYQGQQEDPEKASQKSMIWGIPSNIRNNA